MGRMSGVMRSFSAVVIGAALVLSGCAPQGGSSAPATSSPTSAATTAPAPSTAVFDPTATVRIAQIPVPPPSWDPIQASAVSRFTYLSLVYDRLVVLRPDFTIGPMLATSWSFSSDGKTLDMQLRKDVKFWDGTPFNARVAKANIDRAKSSAESLVKGEIAILNSVEVADDFTIRLRLSASGYGLLYNLAGGSGVGMMVNPSAIDKPELKTKPFGSGAFQVASQTQDRVLYQRWSGYWEPTVARAATLEIIGIANDNARLNALRSGQVDLINVRIDQYAEVGALSKSGQFKFYTYDSPSMSVMFINTKRPGLDNLDVRRALSLAIDRKAISDKLLHGQCTPTVQPFPPGVVGHDRSLESVPTYDPAKAKQLLASAGRSELALRVLLAGAQPNDSISEAIQGQFADVGVKVAFTKTTANEALATWAKGEFDAIVLTTGGAPDPSAFVDRFLLSASYQVGGAPPALTALADDARALPLDSPKRNEAYQKIAQYHVANPTHAIICVTQVQWLATPSVLGVDEMAISRVSGVVEPRTIGMARK